MNDWAETTITYDNAPVIINSTNNSNPLATAQIPGANDGTKNTPRFAFDAGYSFTFTSTQLLDFFRTDTNGVVTLIFQYASGGLDFMFPMAFSESIEPSYRPTLDVAEILEPAVLALVSGIGALGVVLRRRIRRGNS